MKRNQIRQVRIHVVPSPDGKSVEDRVNEFHAAIIDRRLRNSELPPAQKLAVLDRVMKELTQV